MIGHMLQGSGALSLSAQTIFAKLPCPLLGKTWICEIAHRHKKVIDLQP